MLHVVLVGIGEDSVELVKQALDDYKSNTIIEALIFNENYLLPQSFFNQYPIKEITDLPQIVFDKLVICTDETVANDAVGKFRQQLNLTSEQCNAYIRKKIGSHQIDWNSAQTDEELKQQIIHSGTMNDLESFFYCGEHRPLSKWAHYFEVYDRHFSKYRGKAPIVMEIGIFKGGSLQMWKNYFGADAQIIGVDIEEDTKSFEEERISIEIGSQEDRSFLKYLKEKYPRIDILIDDGGHTMNQQIVTFEEMFPHLSYGGTYLCEDLHSSYLDEYGGGYKNPNSYIEYSKNFIDYLHTWYSRDENFQTNQFSRTMHSLHYYDSMLVVEKEKSGPPVSLKSPEF